jgi:ribosomal protein S18 acetylase RimI-like enzyme
MEDPMGDHPAHDELKQLQLIESLKNHPTAEVLLLYFDEEPAGLATTFINFSTFAIKPYLYIHDVVVLERFRGRGLGKALIAELIRISEERAYSKITLEVREDNPGAQQVYRSLGFEECEPRMYFWTKKL